MENESTINRIELKKYELNDLNSMKGLLTNDKIKQTYMIPDFESEQVLDNFFAKLMEWSHSQQHYERGIYYQEHLIGFMNDVEIDGKSLELGYVIHPDYHNQGFATEALKLAIEELFLLGFEEVRAGAFEENTASFQVMRKCGMIQIEKEDEIQYRGKQYRCLYYGITKNSGSTYLDLNQSGGKSMIFIMDVTSEKDIDKMYKIESQICKEMSASCWQLHRGGISFDRYLCGEGLMDIFDYGKLIFLDRMPIGYAYIFSDDCEFELRVLPKYECFYEEIISKLERQYQFGEDYIIVANNKVGKLVKALSDLGYVKKEEERFQAMACLTDLETKEVDWVEERIEEYSEKFFSERVEYADLPTGQKVTEKMFVDYLSSREHVYALEYVIQDCKTKKYAGFLTWWVDLSSGTALLEPVACLAEFRRRGIMKRSLESGFLELKKRGIEYVYVSTSARNQAAQALYLSVGFKKVGEANIYQREK